VQPVSSPRNSPRPRRTRRGHPSSNGDNGARAAQPGAPSSNGDNGRGTRGRIARKVRAGMGTVYLAKDTQLDRPITLKAPYLAAEDGPEMLPRFYQEAKAPALRYGDFSGGPSRSQVSTTSPRSARSSVRARWARTRSVPAATPVISPASA
jgi:hypothetical protein